MANAGHRKKLKYVKENAEIVSQLTASKTSKRKGIDKLDIVDYICKMKIIILLELMASV